jgi:hypothetical protein
MSYLYLESVENKKVCLFSKNSSDDPTNVIFSVCAGWLDGSSEKGTTHVAAGFG